MIKYSWKDGCFYCKNSIDITDGIYTIPWDDICKSPLPPRWYGCKLKIEIKMERAPFPPENCPLR